jgi:hypothetical protein
MLGSVVGSKVDKISYKLRKMTIGGSLGWCPLRVPATKTDAVIAAEKIKGRPFGAAFCLSEMSAEARFR